MDALPSGEAALHENFPIVRAPWDSKVSPNPLSRLHFPVSRVISWRSQHVLWVRMLTEELVALGSNPSSSIHQLCAMGKRRVFSEPWVLICKMGISAWHSAQHTIGSPLSCLLFIVCNCVYIGHSYGVIFSLHFSLRIVWANYVCNYHFPGEETGLRGRMCQ